MRRTFRIIGMCLIIQVVVFFGITITIRSRTEHSDDAWNYTKRILNGADESPQSRTELDLPPTTAAGSQDLPPTTAAVSQEGQASPKPQATSNINKPSNKQQQAWDSNKNVAAVKRQYRSNESVKSKSVLFEKLHDLESFTHNHVVVIYSQTGLDVPPDIPPSYRVETLRTLIRALQTFLVKHKVEFWISHGTLLGSYRSATVIPWDVDADFAVTRDSVNTLQNILPANENTPQEEFFGVKDVQMIVRTGLHSDVIPMKFVNVTNGIYVDFFLFSWIKNDQFLQFKWPGNCHTCNKNGRQYFTVEKQFVFPLKNCTLEEMKFPCPANSLEYLKMWYGNDLSVPKQYRNWH